MTLESPVRFPIAGVSQSQVGGAAGLDFAGGLQAILHQEPDVVGLTDVPDRATLEMVFAAGRRCLVVALCGFRDNQQALDWIRDAGVSAATIGLLLRGILAQRLLPKICSACREPLAEPVRLIEAIRAAKPMNSSFTPAAAASSAAARGAPGGGDFRAALLQGGPARPTSAG